MAKGEDVGTVTSREYQPAVGAQAPRIASTVRIQSAASADA